MTRIVAICPTVGIAASAAAFKYEKKNFSREVLLVLFAKVI